LERKKRGGEGFKSPSLKKPRFSPTGVLLMKRRRKLKGGKKRGLGGVSQSSNVGGLGETRKGTWFFKQKKKKNKTPKTKNTTQQKKKKKKKKKTTNKKNSSRSNNKGIEI